MRPYNLTERLREQGEDRMGYICFSDEPFLISGLIEVREYSGVATPF